MSILRCVASNDPTVISRPTPPAWPVGVDNSTWINGVEYYRPTVLEPRPLLDIEFRNDGTRAITSIRFAVYIANTLVTEVKDAGRFSPGVRISHELKLPKNTSLPPGDATCVPLEVAFEDGTSVRYSSTRLKSRSNDAK